MSRKILNPFAGRQDYNCFGCCPDNPLGLKMTFTDDGDYVVCAWHPSEAYSGFTGILHGGIQATLIDELGAWTVMVKLGTSGVTSKMEMKYRKPVQIKRDFIRLRARIVENNPKVAVVECVILGEEDSILTEASVHYFLYPEERARKELYYPGKASFFKD